MAERPVTAACAFKQLMAPELHQYSPEGTNARAIEHSDEEVASTLGGLAKLMVLCGDIPSALTAVAEWMGMPFNAAACSHAQSAFCNLLKRHGDEVHELNLSRSTHSNWPSTMLRGKGFLELLASCLWPVGTGGAQKRQSRATTKHARDRDHFPLESFEGTPGLHHLITIVAESIDPWEIRSANRYFYTATGGSVRRSL